MSPFLYLSFSVIVALSKLGGVVAPFPDTHPYNPLNPWIEPWWEQLTKTEQKTLYGHWERIQPVAVAVANMIEAKMRAKDSFKKILGSKTKYLKEVIHEAVAAVKGKRGIQTDRQKVLF